MDRKLAMHQSRLTPPESADRPIDLFLCGDVMTGRGVDQILPHPSDPTLHERAAADASVYVELAEKRSGPIPRSVEYTYIWGEALETLERASPDLRIINLETAITTSDDHWEDKGVHYRMNPRHAPCLNAAGIDCCVLANNHVLDWGYAGLEETLETLRNAGINAVGAGRVLEEAQRPAVFELTNQGRVLVFGAGSTSSGIPLDWAAAEDRPGVHLVDETLPGAVSSMRNVIERFSLKGDLIVVSIHWGPNWGYRIFPFQRRFAHALIESAGVDVVHGHSSHHVKGIELHRNRPILYGCGDFLTDYEGIEGYERYRGDLGLMYLVRMSSRSHELMSLEMNPTKMNRLQVKGASPSEIAWVADLLNREGRTLGTRVEELGEGVLALRHR